MRTLITFFGALIVSSTATYSSELRVQCGQIQSQEFVKLLESHTFIVPMSVSEILEVKVLAAGETLLTAAQLTDFIGNELRNSEYSRDYTLISPKLSANGEYKVYIRNFENRFSDRGRVGQYTVGFSCVSAGGQRKEASGMGGAVPVQSNAQAFVPTAPAPTGNPSIDAAQQALQQAQSGALGQILVDQGLAGDLAKVNGYIGLAGQVVQLGKGLKSLFKKKEKNLEAQLAAPNHPNMASAQPISTAVAYAPAPTMPASPPAPIGPKFAGLAPVGATPMPTAKTFGPEDIAALDLPEVELGVPLEAAVPPEGDLIVGCRFAISFGMDLDLGIKRVAGAHRLSLILVDPAGQLIFSAQLLANSETATTVTLTAPGEYRLGIRDIPGAVAQEATIFQLRLTERKVQKPTLTPITKKKG